MRPRLARVVFVKKATVVADVALHVLVVSVAVVAVVVVVEVVVVVVADVDLLKLEDYSGVGGLPYFVRCSVSEGAGQRCSWGVRQMSREGEAFVRVG